MTDIRDKQKQIKKYENTLLSFAKRLLTKQEIEMSRLKKHENVSADASVHELTNSISETLSLLDGPLTEPNIPKFVIPECQELADDIYAQEEHDNEVIQISH